MSVQLGPQWAVGAWEWGPDDDYGDPDAACARNGLGIARGYSPETGESRRIVQSRRRSWFYPLYAIFRDWDPGAAATVEWEPMTRGEVHRLVFGYPSRELAAFLYVDSTIRLAA